MTQPCVDGSSLTVVDGDLTLNTGPVSPHVLHRQFTPGGRDLFAHNASPGVVEYVDDYGSFTVPVDSYLLVEVVFGAAQVALSSYNAGHLDGKILLGEGGLPSSAGVSQYTFGNGYDAGMNFIWRNQGIIDTRHPVLLSDVNLDEVPLGSSFVSGGTSVNVRILLQWFTFHWNGGGGAGSSPHNETHYPSISLTVYGYPA